MKTKIVHGFVIGTFVSLYLLVSVISTIHVIDFFKMSNPYWLAVSLAVAFELGAAASLASLIILDKMNKGLVWALFIVITLMQMQGNMYYAFVNIKDFQGWSELFGLIEEDIIYQKRILAAVSGAILPLVALGFIKSLVDYIKPSPKEEIPSESIPVEMTEGDPKALSSEEPLNPDGSDEFPDSIQNEQESEDSEFDQEEFFLSELQEVESEQELLEETIKDETGINSSLAEEEAQAILEDQTETSSIVSGYYGDVVIDGNGVSTEETSILPVNSNKKGAPQIDDSSKVSINPMRL